MVKHANDYYDDTAEDDLDRVELIKDDTNDNFNNNNRHNKNNPNIKITPQPLHDLHPKRIVCSQI